MPTPADRPLRKVTLNLYEEDAAWLETNAEQWTTWVRDTVHFNVRQWRQADAGRKATRTLGDLDA